MYKGIILLLACALAAGFAASAGLAQTPYPNYGENHYLVYDVFQTGIIFFNTINLSDQFSDFFQLTDPELDLFANPVDKNGEGIVNEAIHQTWWPINDPEVKRRLTIENQFELPGTWHVKNGKYLVLPATKSLMPPVPPLPEPWNHYKCYEEISDNPEPIIFTEPLILQDQIFTYTVTQLTRIYFCNPCVKEVLEGRSAVYVPPDPVAHLAVYRIDPLLTFQTNRWVADQFGEREVTMVNPMWLVVPSLKLEAVTSEAGTWGGVKSLYR